MKKQILLFCLIFLATASINATIKVSKLLCEYANNPLAVDIHKPRLSWINISPANIRGEMQTAWEIRVASSKDKLLSGNSDLWLSGKVSSNASVNISYSGKPLASRQDCWWQVRVWDKNGKVSEWSEAASWSMGLLNPEDWKASWIGAPWQNEAPLQRPKRPGKNPLTDSADLLPPAPLLRKTFIISKEIESARAFVTGLGFFEFYVNGKKAGDDVMSPNLTLYGKRDDLGEIGVMIDNNFREYRVMYLTYNIKDLLKKGENVFGAILGNGFYNPGNYWTQGYGSPRFIGQIHIKYTDGTEQIVISDKTWKASKGPIIMDMIYEGEHYDARLEQPGWNTPGFNDSGWQNVSLRTAPDGALIAQISPIDKIMESLPPIKIDSIGTGHYKVDFGQEISGWLHLLNIKGENGRKIDIKYICESPNGSNSYIMKGESPESYAARFTWFVFREVEITNWPGILKPEQIRAEAVYSDVATSGHFESSNPLFNQINKIWWRSQTDNMHGGIASDCPHRERSPYTGDGQVSCITVMHNFDARTFYTKWIRDMWGAQNPVNGYVPNGAPWQPGCGGGVAWGAAINIMPWEFYVHYGDVEMLKNNYDAMKAYIKYMLTWTDSAGIMYSQAPDSKKPNQWINLGDWCSPGKLPPNDMVHTFYLWRCADLTAKSAKALSKNTEAEEYHKLAEKTKVAFHNKYFDKEKRTYGPNGGNIFALKMGVPDNQLSSVLSALKADIKANNGHLDTGIFGTQFFFEVLAEYGMNELAYEAMNKKTRPGFGWWIEQGATTTWEQWDGKGSRNHPMFGGGIVWFYRKLAGMNADPAYPGYRNIIFRPQPAKDISFASYSNETPHGQAGISWKKETGKFIMKINVPVGSTAIVYVPASSISNVTESGLPVDKVKSIKFLRMDGGLVEQEIGSDSTLRYEESYAVLNVGSGTYSFESLR